MKCLNCGKKSVSDFCTKCNADFPNDFSKDRPITELMTEFHRNRRLKEQFSCDKELGLLKLDMLNGIFHIGNIYHNITELKKYSFHTSTPKFVGILWRRDVEEEIYFTYRLQNGVKNTVRIDTAICSYRNDGNLVNVEPPLKLFGYQQQFSQFVDSAVNRIIKNINHTDKLTDCKDNQSDKLTKDKGDTEI